MSYSEETVTAFEVKEEDWDFGHVPLPDAKVEGFNLVLCAPVIRLLSNLLPQSFMLSKVKRSQLLGLKPKSVGLSREYKHKGKVSSLPNIPRR
jgi:hypothetical protein